MTRKVLEVFLSSTAEDLKPFRAEVYKRLMSRGIFHCVRQEDFGAQNARAVEYCRKQVQAADIFVGLIGLRRGWEPKGDKAKRSITEMEHDWARKAGVRRYLWIAPHDFPVAGHIRESDSLHARQQAFRTKIMANGERIVSQAGFGSPELLAADVVDRLLIEIVTSDLIRELRPELSSQGSNNAEDERPTVAAAVERLAVDKDVDLLALAKHPEGADLADLEAKLKARADQLGAESAEYWRHIGALAFLYDTPKALAAYKKAVSFDPSNPEGWRSLGELQFRHGDLTAAEKSFTTLMDFPDDRSRCLGYVRLAWICRARGDLPAAEKMSTEALFLAERAQWVLGTAIAYGNLGNIYQITDELDRAEKMTRESLARNEALGNRRGVASAFSNLGVIYLKRGELDRAEKMQLEASALDKALGRKEGLARDYNELGAVYCLRGELDRAEEMQLKSLALSEELDSKSSIARALGSLGRIYWTRGELDRAEEIQLNALALNDTLGRKEGMATTYGNLAEIHQARNDRLRMREYKCKERDLWHKMGLARKAVEVEEWLRDNGCDAT